LSGLTSPPQDPNGPLAQPSPGAVRVMTIENPAAVRFGARSLSPEACRGGASSRQEPEPWPALAQPPRPGRATAHRPLTLGPLPWPTHKGLLTLAAQKITAGEAVSSIAAAGGPPPKPRGDLGGT